MSYMFLKDYHEELNLIKEIFNKGLVHEFIFRNLSNDISMGNLYLINFVKIMIDYSYSIIRFLKLLV